MSVHNRLRAGVAGILVLLVAGTTGYVIIEGVSVLDAFSMVSVTITTVGVAEVFGLSAPGRALTMAILVIGVPLALFTGYAAIERLVDTESRTRRPLWGGTPTFGRRNNRLWVGTTGLGALAVAGTLGYMVVEGVTPLDAFYMVLITITTVGFGEVFDLSQAGRLITIAIMLFGVGLALYTASAAIERLLDIGLERRRNRTRKLIHDFENHVIVCGYGRVGRGVYRTLVDRGERVVVIEKDAASHADAEADGIPAILGDATFNETLETAGIGHARSLVACVADDSDNLVIILSARSLRSDIHLVSRASEQESESKLRLAGADRVVAPQVVGSERLAAMAVETNLTEVFDVFVGGRAVEFSVEELVVAEGSPVVGSSIRTAAIRERSGALILAVEDRTRRLLQTPSPEHVLEPNTAVIVVGTSAQVDAAAKLFASG